MPAASPRPARRRRSTTGRTRPSSRASWAPTTRSTSTSRRPSAGVEIRRLARAAAVPWSGAAPVGPVHGLFPRRRREARRARRARRRRHRALPGRIAQRAYPGGHYRYAVAIGDRHFTVTDERYLDLDTPVGLRLPLGGAAPVPKRQRTRNKGGTEPCVRQFSPRSSRRRADRAGRRAAADAQRRHRRRPEHGRLHQGLSRADVREEASRREGRRRRHRARATPARRRSTRSSTRRRRAAPRNPTSTSSSSTRRPPAPWWRRASCEKYTDKIATGRARHPRHRQERARRRGLRLRHADVPLADRDRLQPRPRQGPAEQLSRARWSG